MVTKRLPKPKWTLSAKVYAMPAAVEAELMALGAKHNNTGDPQLSDEENFTPDNREMLNKAFIEAVETYWSKDEFKKGPTDTSEPLRVCRRLQPLRGWSNEDIEELLA
jgi:hypothetical protein